MSDTPYDFIDPDQPERKREVQRRIEMKDNDEVHPRATENEMSDQSEDNSDWILNWVKTACGIIAAPFRSGS